MHWTPERLVELADAYIQAVDEPLGVLWAEVEGSRDEIADAVRALRGASSIAPYVLRNALFGSPNAYGDDVLRVLEEVREDLSAAAMSPPIVLLVLTHERITARQHAASPATLPRWLGSLPCQTVVVPIDNIDSGVTVRLDAPEVDSGGLRAALFEVEHSLVERLLERLGVSGTSVDALGQLLKVEEDYSGMAEFLADAKQAIRGVASPDGFRPGGMTKSSVVSRLYRRSATWTLDQFDTPSSILADTLDLPERAAELGLEGIVTLMFRSNNPRLDAPVRFSRSLIAAIYAACQVLNGVAHPGDYPKYPVGAIANVSGDLKHSFLAAAEIIRS